MNLILLLFGVAALGYTVCVLSRLWHDNMRQEDLVFLQILVPRKEAKEDRERESEQFSTGQDFREILGVMDHLFRSLHSMYNPRINRLWLGQPFFSMEYAALAQEILFFIVCPRKLTHLIEKQITSFYPDTIVEEVEDYNIFTEESVVTARMLLPGKSYTSSFQTYQQLKSDPLNTITNAFSKLKGNEGAAMQLVLSPVRPGWQKKLQREASAVINPKKQRPDFWNPVSWLSVLFGVFAYGTQELELSTEEKSHERVSQMSEEYSKALDEKASSPGFYCVIRIVASADSAPRARTILDTVVASFSQFQSVRGNSFKNQTLEHKSNIIRGFIRRNPRRTTHQWLRARRMLLGTNELTGFFHFPHTKYNKVETIKWQAFKTSPAPKDVPSEGGLILGTNTYRGEKRKICLKPEDRFRHCYIIGQTGTGKSSVIQSLARQDFHNGNGLCVIDPHGPLIEDLLPYIPRERADDVIYFNPVDTERPMGLNLLEAETDEEKDLIALDAMNMMIKMFGEEIFGPRIQDYFRNGCLTLMSDEEDGGAITDLVRLFTDDNWQRYKVSKVKNPIVRSFWENQMAKTGAREKGEMIPYFAAKFGQFYTNTLIRNIVGQTHSSFDIAQCMNEGKILLMNLSKGLIGDINAQLLGMIIVNKIQVAAMRRQRSGVKRDFFLYIDEFQNFVTPSIESILSEARKYRLGLIIAHQYLDQLEKENRLSGSVSLKGAVFGNVGTMMFYKIGPQDAEVCAKEMAPVFSEQDLINFDAFKAAIKLSVDGKPSKPFSIEVARPWLDTTYAKDADAAEAYKQLSRLRYGRKKDFVSREILRRIGA